MRDEQEREGEQRSKEISGRRESCGQWCAGQCHDERLPVEMAVLQLTHLC